MIPRLVETNHQVTVVSRGHREAYQPHSAWEKVENVVIDKEKEEAEGTFGKKILGFKPDAVIDMICFTPESAKHLVEALRGKVRQMLFCGTIWIHGHTIAAPTTEDQGTSPFGEYGIQKAAMTEYLLNVSRLNNLPITVIHPGHIVGPGWNPLNPLGNFNPRVFETLARGDTLYFPTLGLETVHHVHADDVARIFVESLTNWSSVIGEDFHIVSEAAVTLRGYAETVASWFNKKADLRFEAGDEWKNGYSEQDIEYTWEHIRHSPNCSMEKAKQYFGFKPRYTSFEAVYEALMWLIANKVVKI
jgi:nucleoside-diphosphate-sugar epimerase